MRSNKMGLGWFVFGYYDHIPCRIVPESSSKPVGRDDPLDAASSLADSLVHHQRWFPELYRSPTLALHTSLRAIGERYSSQRAMVRELDPQSH